MKALADLATGSHAMKPLKLRLKQKRKDLADRRLNSSLLGGLVARTAESLKDHLLAVEEPGRPARVAYVNLINRI